MRARHAAQAFINNTLPGRLSTLYASIRSKARTNIQAGNKGFSFANPDLTTPAARAAARRAGVDIRDWVGR